jgi:hypothetical protein
MPQQAQPRDQARFVFQGTVQSVNEATLAAVTNTKNTCVVRVEQILRGSDMVAEFAGRRITVRAAGARKLKAGEQGTFYTNVWLLGESLAVELLDFEPLQPTAAMAVAALGAAPTASPTENLKQHEFTNRVASADVVLSGRVTSVRLVEDAPAMAATARAAGSPAETQTTSISEHDPVWQEATIEVGAVHKGSHGNQTAVIRFPASTDVRWYQAPKLTPGQEGVFVLQAGERSAAGRAEAALAANVPAGPSGYYTALEAADFQPLEHGAELGNIGAAVAAVATRVRARPSRPRRTAKAEAPQAAAGQARKKAAKAGSVKAGAKSGTSKAGGSKSIGTKSARSLRGGVRKSGRKSRSPRTSS